MRGPDAAAALVACVALVAFVALSALVALPPPLLNALGPPPVPRPRPTQNR
jgi:hypothetical protein